MEKKKELLIGVLIKLKPYRDLAEGILALVESSYVDENVIDGVIRVLAKTLREIKGKQQRSALQKGMKIIRKMKKEEEKEKEDQQIDQELEKELNKL